MSRGAKVAIIAGIIVAVAIGAAVALMSSTSPPPGEIVDTSGGNTTTGKNYVVELNENIEIRESQ